MAPPLAPPLVVLRPHHAQTGVIRAGAGSAMVELNNTRVMCAVYGPQVDARQEFSVSGRLACEVKIAEFARPGRERSASAAADESALADEMQKALSPSVRLEAYPKCSWQICAFVIEDDGSTLAALITCASLALADAEVEMFDLVAACSVVCTADCIAATPNATEEAGALGHLLLATMPASGKVTSLQSTGLVPASIFDDAYGAVAAACALVATMMRATLIAASDSRRAADAAGADGADRMVV